MKSKSEIKFEFRTEGGIVPAGGRDPKSFMGNIRTLKVLGFKSKGRYNDSTSLV